MPVFTTTSIHIAIKNNDCMAGHPETQQIYCKHSFETKQVWKYQAILVSKLTVWTSLYHAINTYMQT